MAVLEDVMTFTSTEVWLSRCPFHGGLERQITKVAFQVGFGALQTAELRPNGTMLLLAARIFEIATSAYSQMKSTSSKALTSSPKSLVASKWAFCFTVALILGPQAVPAIDSRLGQFYDITSNSCNCALFAQAFGPRVLGHSSHGHQMLVAVIQGHISWLGVELLMYSNA